LEIHRPKAVHGWREFVKEVGIIVLGVLIALAAEQTAETLRHEHQVKVGERALKENYAQFIEQRAELDASTACVAQRLAQLRSIVDEGARHHALGQVSEIPQPPPHSWEITSWETMVSSQAASHVPQEEVIRYAQLAHWAHDAHETGTSETDVWASFAGLTGRPRPFSEAEEAMLRANIARAAHLSGLLRDIAGTIETGILKTGRLTPEEIAKARQRGAHRPSVLQMCSPISYRPAQS
jgi:hypothetical protein